MEHLLCDLKKCNTSLQGLSLIQLEGLRWSTKRMIFITLIKDIVSSEQYEEIQEIATTTSSLRKSFLQIIAKCLQEIGSSSTWNTLMNYPDECHTAFRLLLTKRHSSTVRKTTPSRKKVQIEKALAYTHQYSLQERPPWSLSENQDDMACLDKNTYRSDATSDVGYKTTILSSALPMSSPRPHPKQQQQNPPFSSSLQKESIPSPQESSINSSSHYLSRRNNHLQAQNLQLQRQLETLHGKENAQQYHNSILQSLLYELRETIEVAHTAAHENTREITGSESNTKHEDTYWMFALPQKFIQVIRYNLIIFLYLTFFVIETRSLTSSSSSWSYYSG